MARKRGYVVAHPFCWSVFARFFTHQLLIICTENSDEGDHTKTMIVRAIMHPNIPSQTLLLFSPSSSHLPSHQTHQILLHATQYTPFSRLHITPLSHRVKEFSSLRMIAPKSTQMKNICRYYLLGGARIIGCDFPIRGNDRSGVIPFSAIYKLNADQTRSLALSG